MFDMNFFQAGTNPTNLPLAYLGFSLFIILVCAAALLRVVRKWQQGRYPQGFRMIQGLTGLIILRLITFLYTYFSWQSEAVFTHPLLVLDQGVSLLGLILILWLWSFPEPSREVDPAVLGVIGLISVLVILQILVIPSLLTGFTGTMLFWQGLSIFLLLLGSGIIAFRKPNFWPFGVFMGGILAIGSILALISTDLEPLHLAQLAAYPLLLLLGERFPIAEFLSHESVTLDDLDRRSASVDIAILSRIQKLFDDKDPAGILYNIAQTTSYLILADLTLVIDTPDEHGKLRIIAGYDLIREEPLQALTLDSKSVPLLSNYIERGKMLHIPASSTSRDLSNLSKVLQLTKPGHLLASPVYIPVANKTIGVVLFSPFSNRPWTKADQEYLRTLSKLFVAAFSHHLASQNGESDSVKNTIRDLSAKLTRLTQDKQQLKEDKVILSKEHQNLLLDQDVFKTKYDQLLAWSNALNQHLVMLVDLEKKESTEALRKYISVIEKEIKDIKETKAVEFKERIPEPVLDHTPEEDDLESHMPANLVEAIKACLEDADSFIKEKKLKTKLDIPDDPPLLKMNHALFQEIFSFLVSNAIEESKSGEEIMIRTQIYEEDQTQHFAHINITDKGDGYFPDEIAAVLNDNLTAEQQEELSQVMTNLYVTKNLVENEGGRMWVESVPGEGTTVSLLLAFQ
jgi:signal transduction histidine kinase